jgi:hypothetical protein
MDDPLQILAQFSGSASLQFSGVRNPGIQRHLLGEIEDLLEQLGRAQQVEVTARPT